MGLRNRQIGNTAALPADDEVDIDDLVAPDSSLEAAESRETEASAPAEALTDTPETKDSPAEAGQDNASEALAPAE